MLGLNFNCVLKKKKTKMKTRFTKRQISSSLKLALFFCFFLIFFSTLFRFHYIECGFCRLEIIDYKLSIVRMRNHTITNETPRIVKSYFTRKEHVFAQTNATEVRKDDPLHEISKRNASFSRGFPYWLQKLSNFSENKKTNATIRSNKEFVLSKEYSELQIDFENWNESTCEKRMNLSSTMEDAVEEYEKRKYIFVLSLPEQLSKARRHLAEVVYFAKSFNRTLILPRVGNSRIGVSQNLSFCVYFDEIKLGKYVNWVTEEFYFQTMWKLNYQPSPTFLCIKQPNSSEPCFSQTEPTEYTRAIQFSNGYFPNHNDIRASYISKSHTEEEEKAISSFFSKFKEEGIVIYKKTKFNASTLARGPPLAHVEYSRYLHKIADELISQYLSPRFVALHMRFEYIATFRISSFGTNLVRRVASCSHSFISLLYNLMEDDAPMPVFIASDVSDAPNLISHTITNNEPNLPATSNTTTFAVDKPKASKTSTLDENRSKFPTNFGHILAKSDTWFELNNTLPLEVSYEGFRLVKDSFRGKTLQALFPRIASMDGGVQGVVDKLVCAKADFFVSASRKCGGGGNFERQILKYRQRYGLKQWLTFA